MHYNPRKILGLLPLLCLCTVVLSTSAKQWSPLNFPNPVKDIRLCGRGGKPSWICDPDHVLSEYSQNVIEGSIHEIATAQDPYRSAHCPKPSPDAAGYQVAVALVDRMKLENGRTQAEQAEFFAKSLHKNWGVGDATCNSGLVLFLSKDDRQMYLAADEQVLSQDRQLYVLDRLKQKLRQGDFDGGIESAVVDIGLGLSGADMPVDIDSSGWDWGLGIIGLILGGFMCNSCWSGFRRRREATTCRTLLQKLKDEQASAVRNQQYPATSCPICFEDLAKPDGASGLPSAASTFKDGQSDSEHGGNSSKFDVVAPSAPPLDAHPERASLLGESKAQSSSDQETHKHSRWLNDKNSCPVCRKPLTDDQPQDPQMPRGSMVEGADAGLVRQHNWNNDMYASEVMFRMGRLQRMYPYFVTRDMITDWGSCTTQGQQVNWDAARSLQVNDSQVRQSHYDWGSHGTTTDFGGGGGYGGGGTGGSW
ncbi:hypothetical protein ABBQ32_005931 [Trebouxia sp. C0010 RCD-2024]